jgi:3-oxoacyl-[acyl-carrier protein] reductase
MNIVITGGASGLGRAITEHLAKRPNDRVLFTFCRSKDAAQSLVSQYPNVRGTKCDFKDQTDLERFLTELEGFDADVLVHNAYTALNEQHFHKTEAAEFKKSFEENVLPVIAITQRAIKTFRKKKSGKIITILSTALLGKPSVGWAQYTANKAYLRSLSKSWAVENSAFNIASNCILPSFLGIGMTATTDERIKEQLLQKYPRGFLTAQEVAESVGSLIDSSADVNGTEVILNPAEDHA